MPKLNIMKAIKNSIGTINPRYDLCYQDYEEIHMASTDRFDRELNLFRFGYIQGVKCERARQKKMKGSKTRNV